MFTRVYLCLLVFTYVYSSSPMCTTVYSCMFTYDYPCLVMFTLLNFTRFLMFNYVYLCFPFPTIYSYVYLFTHV